MSKYKKGDSVTITRKSPYDDTSSAPRDNWQVQSKVTKVFDHGVRTNHGYVTNKNVQKND